MYMDEERREMSAFERVYGYTGACGMIQGLAAGYFLWDLVVTSRNVGIFGVGMWAHAVCALCVFSFGFVSSFLSSPLLSLHFISGGGRGSFAVDVVLDSLLISAV